MNTLLVNALIWHIFSGIAGIVTTVVVMFLLKNELINGARLKIYSFFSFLFFLLSWITGGYYYTVYYGRSVKPIITSGPDSWVHQILMESKEHIFLFVPFASLVVFLVANLLAKEVGANKQLKKSLLFLCFVIVCLGMAITISGMAISGSVVKK